MPSAVDQYDIDDLEDCLIVTGYYGIMHGKFIVIFVSSLQKNPAGYDKSNQSIVRVHGKHLPIAHGRRGVPTLCSECRLR